MTDDREVEVEGICTCHVHVWQMTDDSKNIEIEIENA
jgi:hypothetical protein